MAFQRRRKTYNKFKSMSLFARNKMKNMGVWYDYRTEGRYPFKLLNVKTVDQIKLTDINTTTLKEFKHKWQIILINTGKDDTGAVSFNYDRVQITEYMFQRDLVEYLRERHTEFAVEHSGLADIDNYCWLAIPNGADADELTELDIYRVIDKMEGW